MLLNQLITKGHFLRLVLLFPLSRIHRTGSLRLYNIGPQDSGLYRCTASNLLGEDVAEGYLTVTGGEMNLEIIAFYEGRFFSYL